MRSIVSTIQREQNSAIRHESTKLLSIQGAAGSGKTSVALHRASYLLYRHKKNIKSANLVILSSTNVLGDYISDVLPELGEDEIKGVTFKDIFLRYSSIPGYRVESHPQLLERILTDEDSDERRKTLAAVSFKSSPAFFTMLNRFFDFAVNHLFIFEDIRFKNHMIASKEELNRLFFEDFTKMPPLARLKRMENRINELVKPLKRAQQEKKARDIEEGESYISSKEARALSFAHMKHDTHDFYEGLNRMFSIDSASVYMKLFELDEAWNTCLGDKGPGKETQDYIRSYTLDNFKSGLIGFEDSGPLLYISLLMGETEPDSSVKHLMVDEAQDYSLIQLKALIKLYPTAGITILGDISQNISPYASDGNLERLAKYLSPDDFSYVRLNKSYRSTLEISSFASSYLQGEKGEAFGRHGEKPLIVTASVQDIEQAMINGLLKRLGEGYKTIAIITRTYSEANVLYQSLKKKAKSLSQPFRLMNEEFEYPVEGIMVMPSYLSKGLEFDCVFVHFKDPSFYSDESEKGLLYTILSRALHHLSIYCEFPELPHIFGRIEPIDYTIERIPDEYEHS